MKLSDLLDEDMEEMIEDVLRYAVGQCRECGGGGTYLVVGHYRTCGSCLSLRKRLEKYEPPKIR